MADVSSRHFENSEFSYLRVMLQSDLPEVLNIEQGAYLFPWSQKGFENSLDQGLNYLFCDIEDRVLGYCCLLTVLDEAHLLNFCVRSECQGQGLAKPAFYKLQQQLLEASFRVILLEVRQSNRKARKLYQQLGFVQDGVRKNYYVSEDGKEDAILMSLQMR